MSRVLFPTTVIGSLPRPAWVRDVILDRKAGRLTETDADRLLDPAIDTAIRLQERAGLDEITDGEWRRESYVKVFAERVRGFRPDVNPSGGLPHPAVTGLTPDAVMHALRRGDPPIMVRVHRGELLVDPHCLRGDEASLVARRLREALLRQPVRP